MTRGLALRGVHMNQPMDLGRIGIMNFSRTDNYNNSRETATRFVIDAVESTGAASRDDFDIDRIVTTAHGLVNDWDFQGMQPEAFWRIASTCIRQ
ncbi:hypothetical protein [Nocardia sp. BMG111209]|uniref:hypothetical protein n=1 Tax=Nocardia sp. BMG111209 TaxID=1160137 RepID=UPI001E54DDB3|nr:hypothetical protein [Nocardia sp. BMG111209]